MEIATSFYQENAEAFSDTRFCLWDIVRDFGKQFGPTDYVLDAGCGNGKNINYFQNQTTIMGFDKSMPLLEICKKKGYDVFHSDILDIVMEIKVATNAGITPSTLPIRILTPNDSKNIIANNIV